MFLLICAEIKVIEINPLIRFKKNSIKTTELKIGFIKQSHHESVICLFKNLYTFTKVTFLQSCSYSVTCKVPFGISSWCIGPSPIVNVQVLILHTSVDKQINSIQIDLYSTKSQLRYLKTLFIQSRSRPHSLDYYIDRERPNTSH